MTEGGELIQLGIDISFKPVGEDWVVETEFVGAELDDCRLHNRKLPACSLGDAVREAASLLPCQFEAFQRRNENA